MNSGKPAPAVNLNARQRATLIKYANKLNISISNKRRITIILQAFEGKSNLSISRELQVTPNTVSKWRNRWVDSYQQLCAYEIEENASDSELLKRMLFILSDKARSGSPVRISLAEKQKLVALACKKPEEFGIPITQWNHEMLAKVAMAEGLVKKISPRYVGDILKKT